MRHLITVLWAPRAAFERLREKVDWVMPLLVLGLLTALYEMVVARSQSTVSAFIERYGVAVFEISVTVIISGLILLAVKSMLRAQAGTFKQLCQVKLFSMAPSLIYLLSKTALLLLVPDMAIDEAGTFTNLPLRLIDTLFGLAMTIWSVILLVIGTAVITEQPSMEVLRRLATIWVVFMLLAFLVWLV